MEAGQRAGEDSEDWAVSGLAEAKASVGGVRDRLLARAGAGRPRVLAGFRHFDRDSSGSVDTVRARPLHVPRSLPSAWVRNGPGPMRIPRSRARNRAELAGTGRPVQAVTRPRRGHWPPGPKR